VSLAFFFRVCAIIDAGGIARFTDGFDDFFSRDFTFIYREMSFRIREIYTDVRYAVHIAQCCLDESTAARTVHSFESESNFFHRKWGYV